MENTPNENNTLYRFINCRVGIDFLWYEIWYEIRNLSKWNLIATVLRSVVMKINKLFLKNIYQLKFTKT